MSRREGHEPLDLERVFLDSLREPCGDAEEPPVERIWEAANGNLSPDETREVLDHVASSRAAAGAWLVARRMADLAGEDEAGEAVAPVAVVPLEGEQRSGRPLLPAAAAAVVLIAAAGGWFLLRGPAPPVYRGEAQTPRSLVADGALLPRDGARLVWEPGPPGSVYNLRVLRAFEPLLVVEGLGEPSFLIPEGDLQGVADGEEIQWQVELVRPDGSRALSETFVVAIRGGRKEKDDVPEGKRR